MVIVGDIQCNQKRLFSINIKGEWETEFKQNTSNFLFREIESRNLFVIFLIYLPNAQ